MNSQELRASLALSLVFVFRMLGLFMVLPVMGLYTQQLSGASAITLGLAIGGYGFTQALLQIPFGRWSDRFGRKPLIYAGLLLFFVGSVVAALSTSIYGVIIGRMLQGAGAISAVITALVADLTREEQRTKAMAMIGGAIGVAFALAMVLGPWLSSLWGLSGVFYTNGGMALLAMVVVAKWVPAPSVACQDLNRQWQPQQWRTLLSHRDLMLQVLGIFTLQFVLMAMFVYLPEQLSHVIHPSQHGVFYLAVMGGAFVLMLPLMVLGERRGKSKQCYQLAIVLMIAGELGLLLSGAGQWSLVWAMLLFFIGFNLMEAVLPSLASKLSPTGARGTAMGLYATGQFLGAALGGMVSGLLYSWLGVHAVVLSSVLLLLLWLLLARPMQVPMKVATP